jgi:sialic acid synthase SpsE/quercetin dioxygenase-like cupin family protein
MNKILIIFEMANNHMGDYKHGLKMIDEFAKVSSKYKDYFDFAWKFQFRDLNTFIHHSYKDRLDHKYVKRFLETNLTKEQFYKLAAYAKNKEFKILATAFDENSVDLIYQMNLDIIKVASCSFTDWPLLNKIVNTIDKPIILSTAGSCLDDIDRVVSFMQHRGKDISLMHCVGEYPTATENLQLNQIDLLQQRYENIPIGYSTHEKPEEFDAIKLAIAKNIRLTEKHIAVPTDQYPPNAYSVSPEQMDVWLNNAKKAIIMCGIVDDRCPISEKEQQDLLQFKRGAFIKTPVKKGEIIEKNNIYYAWPSIDNQLLANNVSKYNQFIAENDIDADNPIMKSEISIKNTRNQIWNIVQDIKSFLNQSKVIYPGKAELEISHHYGIDKYYDTGITMITVVNREYCKKLIIVLPNQKHPEQFHKEKEETFLILHGEVHLTLDNNQYILHPGDVITIEKGVKHSFTTPTGCIIEEVSSTHYINDSFYTDESIQNNKDRKTLVTHWL